MAAGSTVLVVEDDPIVRSLVTDLLSDEGYSVIAVEDGRAAIMMLRDHFPPPNVLCLVVLDLMLPKVDGLEVLRAVGRLGRYVPVIATSASAEHLRRAADVGANATLTKPFDVEQFLTVVERNCSRRR
jgi:CheY-like chemotaxis protein